MNKKGNSFHRPYEIIETEETLTRYFDPSHSKVSKTDNICQTTPLCRSQGRRNEPNLHEQHGPKMDTRNVGHLQALYEKFKKLRAIMAELTDKFNEINSATPSNLPTSADVHTVEVTDCLTKKLQENLDGNDIGSGECNKKNSHCKPRSLTELRASRVPVASRSDHDQLPALQVIGDDESKDWDTACTPNNDSNGGNVPLLNRSKKLLIRLIDKELHRLQSSPKNHFLDKSNRLPYGNSKQSKIECIDRIAEELAVLKELEVIEDADQLS